MNIQKKNSMFLLLFLLFCHISASGQQSEVLKIKKALIGKIDSCNAKLLTLDENQKYLLIKMATATNENNLLIDFFKKKNLEGERYHAMMNKYMQQNNLDSSYYSYKEAKKNYDNNEKKTISLNKLLLEKFVAWCILRNYKELAVNALNQNIEYNSKNKRDISLFVYSMLSLYYQMSGDFEQAIKVAKIGLKLPIGSEVSNEGKAILCSMIGDCYYAMEDYPTTLAWTDTFYTYIKEIPDEYNIKYASNIRYTHLADYYNLKSIGYSGIGNQEQALAMINKFDSISSLIEIPGFEDKGKALVQSQLFWMNMIYYYFKGDYPKAADYLHKFNQQHMAVTLDKHRDVNKWEALVYEKMGRYKDANLALNKQVHLKDSIYKANSAKEMESLWAMFEVDKAQQEKEKSELKVKTIAGGASTIVIIAIGLMSYFVVTNRKLKEKNKVLFKQQRNLSLSTSIVKSEKKPMAEDHSDAELMEGGLANANKTMYLQIVEYLERTKEYTDTNISRESLAKQLGTNRQYIIDAISENTNMSFNEFINNCRIDYARDLLLSDEDLMIKTVYTDAGFSSRSSFAILFKEKFGMTPSEFRDCAKVELSAK